MKHVLTPNIFIAAKTSERFTPLMTDEKIQANNQNKIQFDFK